MRDNIQTNTLAANLKTPIIEQLESIYDTEIGLDIYNLGLVYKLEVNEDKQCDITISFTGSACSCIETVPTELKEKLSQIDGIDTVNVDVVWEPAWTLDRISRLGRISLGINPN